MICEIGLFPNVCRNISAASSWSAHRSYDEASKAESSPERMDLRKSTATHSSHNMYVYIYIYIYRYIYIYITSIYI